ncbi:MAG: hypothetical protein A2X86_10570 [Bdellovibrionales bacterium GWA2_49_15]|nr:MAG: hypothetical protein A2X86_10570 [Bdellovibrionales bacterium GWA2_49_15]HAZ11418.1 hypothetical protein [Bdellovibrionales bacterium]
MGRISILCLGVYFLLVFSPCHSSEVRGFTYFLSGRDGAGHTLFDRFELYPNGKTAWQIASKGGPCPGEGGFYQGTLNPESAKKILELVHALYQSEKNSKNAPALDSEGDSARHARHLLQVEYDTAVSSFELKGAFANSQAFFQELAFVKAKLSPQRAVRMSVRNEKKGLLVSFLNIGHDPVRLLLPKNPEEVFFLNNAEKLSYQKPPPKRDLTLSSGKTIDFTLAVAGKIQGPLFYDSGVMAHHAQIKLKKDLPPMMELFLCAGESL